MRDKKIKPEAAKKSLRPTTGKVREALFDILRGRIDKTRFLDLYAGTGAVGIKALKEGAAEVVFVESSKESIKRISELVQKSGFAEETKIITKKVLPFIEWADGNRLTFDIIFLDPPYHTDEVVSALSAIGKSHILDKEGVVIAEHFKKRELPGRFGKLYKLRDYRYGDSVLSLYTEVNDEEGCSLSGDV
ncbi:MAG: 16S rRNA (guanine(966)-N(2))-methyltransferase RsmD [Nitrospirae bacterium]|nr:16S rRNA (guanine(966)-N(2))-methyltransferase RsmD [Nitrospirota bacterium]